MGGDDDAVAEEAVLRLLRERRRAAAEAEYGDLMGARDEIGGLHHLRGVDLPLDRVQRVARLAEDGVPERRAVLGAAPAAGSRSGTCGRRRRIWASFSLKSRTPSQPMARQKRVTVGSLTSARRAISALEASTEKATSASTVSATRRSAGRSSA